jgi:hypothetical protein
MPPLQSFLGSRRFFFCEYERNEMSIKKKVNSKWIPFDRLEQHLTPVRYEKIVRHLHVCEDTVLRFSLTIGVDDISDNSGHL